MISRISNLVGLSAVSVIGLICAFMLGVLFGAAALVMDWLTPGRPQPTIAQSLGPTVQQLESIGQITSMRVHVVDVLQAEGEGYRGSWLIRGDALLACDMSKAQIVHRDDESKTAVIHLEPP